MTVREFIWSLCIVLLLSSSSMASSDTIGEDGINSSILQGAPFNLDGMGIFIGQVEEGRPGKPGTDVAANIHNDVIPAEVFRRNLGSAASDATGFPGGHALRVAGVMISKDPGALAGVAKNASLSASAATDNGDYTDHVLTLNHIARRNAKDVRSLNMSFGLLIEQQTTDGNSQYSRGVDWIANTYENTLLVIAGEEVDKEVPHPGDSYNGLVVAASKVKTGVYREVSDLNTYNYLPIQNRTAIGLIAPGEDFPLTNPGTSSTTAPHPAGTSYAAPHVTATVGLFQQLGDRNFDDVGGPQWSNRNYRKNVVSKAVLLNSADKLNTVLGSQRTIISQPVNLVAYDWTQSMARTDDSVPLDRQFGAGHLNALRATTQFSSGEWDPGAPVPNLGWDFGQTGGAGDEIRYQLQNQLTAGEVISLTLCWNRKTDKTGDATNYSPEDIFFNLPDNGLDNLNLFLVPRDSNEFNGAMSLRSISDEMNVEHIFEEVPATGLYDIVVTQVMGGSSGIVKYGLAWWYGNPFMAVLEGDYNRNGSVGPEDYNLWSSTFGDSVTPGNAADGNSDGIINAADYTIWRDASGMAAISTPVPEPTAIMLVLLSLLGLVLINPVSHNLKSR